MVKKTKMLILILLILAIVTLVGCTQRVSEGVKNSDETNTDVGASSSTEFARLEKEFDIINDNTPTFTKVHISKEGQNLKTNFEIKMDKNSEASVKSFTLEVSIKTYELTQDFENLIITYLDSENNVLGSMTVSKQEIKDIVDYAKENKDYTYENNPAVDIFWNRYQILSDEFKSWEIPDANGEDPVQTKIDLEKLNENKPHEYTDEEKSTPPIIKNLGINFDSYDSSTGKAGDFLFDSKLTKPFVEFGGSKDEDSKIIPHFNYYIPLETEIFSVSDGVIDSVIYQEEGNDYEVYVKPFRESHWLINYDHIINVDVKVGDTIEAGSFLGTPAQSSPGIGMVEIQLYSNGTSYPLTNYFAPELKAEYENKIWKLMEDWETFKGNSELYDEETMKNYCAGCLKEKMDDIAEYLS